MKEIIDYAKENMIPIVREQTSKVLVELCKNKNPKNILEIGTAIGYSGILMLSATDASLTTIEKNPERAQISIENFKKYGYSNRVDLKLGDALEELQKLALNPEKFDFIFLDGPKGQYFRYYPYLKQMLTVGGIIFADNVDLLGLLETPEKVNHKNRAMVNNMKKFIETVKNDEEIKATFYHTDDGFCILEKK